MNVYNKHSPIKQYHKKDRALRTETTINNAYDFRIGKAGAQSAEAARNRLGTNRRLLQIEFSHDGMLAEDAFQAINGPIEAGCQQTSGLRLGLAAAIPALRAVDDPLKRSFDRLVLSCVAARLRIKQ